MFTGLKTKVCATIATNETEESFEECADRLRVIQYAQADCVLDMSVGSYIEETKCALVATSQIPIGSLPMLQIGYEAMQNQDGIAVLSKNDFLSIVKTHCADGVDFICLHCGMTRELVNQFKKQNRLSNITSRAAQMLYDWVSTTELENPYYQHFDEILEILKEYDVTLVLASAFKTGSLEDSFDSLQVQEYAIHSMLARKALESGVQVMSEGFGHVQIDKIPTLTKLIKEATFNIPLFVSSSMACDCAVGYDNITSSIASTVAVLNGANMINSTCADDFLNKASIAQVREGIISAKIAAHCGDVANGNSEAIKQNYKISFARANLNWKNIVKNSIDKSVYEKELLEEQ